LPTLGSGRHPDESGGGSGASSRFALSNVASIFSRAS